jgi:diguanylate cyclase (GGDEF)-like protein
MGEGADADAEVRIPRSALGSVQRALASVHAAVGLRATLQAIAEGVTSSTPYTNVTVTTAREPDAVDLHVEAVVGPPDAVAMLLGTTCPRAAMLEHLAGGEAWGALRFWSHFGETDGVIMFVPDYEPLDVPDAWRPEYELMAPLYGPDGELIGTMSLDRPRDGRVPPPWTNEFLELFAEQAAIAILNARRHEQALRAMHTLERERAALHAAFAEQRARETDLRHQTRRDPLTGLANRVLLKERLEELLAAQIPLSVVFCDLDQFKQINDTHGHAVGDEVLRAAGARLARRLAAADVVARIGGDEFVVVAAGVQQLDAPRLLRRIEEAFAHDPVHTGNLSLQLSCSMGLVCEPGGPGVPTGSAAERAEELLSNADREMYAHKRSRAGVHRLQQLADDQPRSTPTCPSPTTPPEP